MWSHVSRYWPEAAVVAIAAASAAIAFVRLIHRFNRLLDALP